MYNEYVTNFDKAAKCLKRRKQKSNKLSAFLEEIRQRPECGKLDLESYLIMPVQRLPRYELLLRDIGRAIPDDQAEVRAKIDKLLATVQDVNQHVNRSKTEAENRDLLRRLNHVTKPKGFNIFDRVDRQLLLDRTFEIYHYRPKKGIPNPESPTQVEMGGARFSTRRFFLFDDYFLVVQEHRGHFKFMRDFDNALTGVMNMSGERTGKGGRPNPPSVIVATASGKGETNGDGDEVENNVEDGDGVDGAVVDSGLVREAVGSSQPFVDLTSSCVLDLPQDEQRRMLVLERKGEWFFCRFADASKRQEWQDALVGAQGAMLKPDSDAMRRRMRKEATAKRSEDDDRSRRRRHRRRNDDRHRTERKSRDRHRRRHSGGHAEVDRDKRRGGRKPRTHSTRERRHQVGKLGEEGTKSSPVVRSRSLGRAATKGLVPKSASMKSTNTGKLKSDENDAKASALHTIDLPGGKEKKSRRRSIGPSFGKGAQKTEKGKKLASPRGN